MDAAFYTRGNPGDEDARGLSMVEKHMAAKQAAKVEQAESALGARLPGVTESARSAALVACDYDIEAAYDVLKEFRAKTGQANLAEAEAKRKRAAISDSSSSSGSDSEGDSGGKKHKKKDKKDKKKSKKKKDKKDKKDKKKKKDKKEDNPDKKALTEQYGKYGVIRESDLWDKRPEFASWAQDTKKIDVEGLSKWEEKEMFAEFMEDYNTATLPHKKYYNLEQWEIKERQKRAKKEGVPAAPEPTAFNDEEQRRLEKQRQREESKTKHMNMLKAVLGNSGTVDSMREQERMKEMMSMHYKTGNMNEAQKLKKRLEPEEAKWDAETGRYRKKA